LSRDRVCRIISTRWFRRREKSAPAAVQELVLLCFLEYRLIISGDIPASDYSDISSLGRRSGGAEPRERHGIRLQAEIGKIHAAAPGGRPGGGSGTCSVDLPGKSLRPNNAGLSRAGSPSGGAKPRECCILENNLK
jgi:hypothetical protein